MNPEAVLALLSLPGVGHAKARSLLHRLDASATLSVDVLVNTAGCTREAAETAMAEARKQIEEAQQAGVSVLEPTTVRWAGLDTPPLVLYAKGTQDILAKPGATLVGTRKPSESAARFTAETAAALSAEEVVVTSGLAFGCDAEAHRGCLDAGGTTIAVLPCDVADPRPKSHRRLAESIVASGGLLLSEYGLGSGEPRKYQFLERNRLQAALGDILVVGETGMEGGTVKTIEQAHKLGRPIFFFRSPEESVRVVHERLASRFAAPLVATPDDVLYAWRHREPTTERQQPSLDRWSA